MTKTILPIRTDPSKIRCHACGNTSPTGQGCVTVTVFFSFAVKGSSNRVNGIQPTSKVENQKREPYPYLYYENSMRRGHVNYGCQGCVYPTDLSEYKYLLLHYAYEEDEFEFAMQKQHQNGCIVFARCT